LHHEHDLYQRVHVQHSRYRSWQIQERRLRSQIRFATFDTTRAELQRLLAKEQPAVVIIEAYLLAGWVHDLCGERGVRCPSRVRTSSG